MDEKIIKFDETEIEKCKFHQRKNPFLIDDIDIDKIVVSNKSFLVKRILNILLTFVHILSRNE